MFIGEFDFNLSDALTARGMQYCPAYRATNEPITHWLPLTPVSNPRVLTVAASGDQPLMYHTIGASDVDTFDITLNACVVMDFKTSALRETTSLSEYQEMVENLIHLDDLDNIGTRQHDTFMRIVNNMPIRTRQLIQNIICKNLYPNAFSQRIARKLHFPIDTTQFNKMQSAIQKPFNFIWSDLLNVHNYINGTYDIINVSNIFDHYLWYQDSLKSVSDAMASLWPHLRDSGYMLCTSTDIENLSTVKLISTMNPKLNANISTLCDKKLHPWMTITFHKIR